MGDQARSAVARTVRGAAAALVPVLVTALLAGCGQNPPGVAAEVGSDRITDDQVDALAEALCVLSTGSAQDPAQGGPVPTQQVRRQALQILLGNQLAAGVIEPGSVDREQLAEARQQAAPSREALPERLRGTFDDAVEGFATLQLGLGELGRASLREDGTAQPEEQEALAEGQRLLAEHAEEVGVSVDPRYGTWNEGQLEPTDGSLSVAVSDEAKASTSTQPTGVELPANLTCTAG